MSDLIRFGNLPTAEKRAADYAAFEHILAEAQAHTKIRIVAYHHRPSACDELAFSPLTAVHVANVLAESEQSAGGDAASLPIDESYLIKLGKLDQLAAWKAVCRPDEE